MGEEEFTAHSSGNKLWHNEVQQLSICRSVFFFYAMLYFMLMFSPNCDDTVQYYRYSHLSPLIYGRFPVQVSATSKAVMVHFWANHQKWHVNKVHMCKDWICKMKAKNDSGELLGNHLVAYLLPRELSLWLHPTDSQINRSYSWYSSTKWSHPGFLLSCTSWNLKPSMKATIQQKIIK